jgi:CDP-glucose 4,6-dehydratase
MQEKDNYPASLKPMTKVSTTIWPSRPVLVTGGTGLVGYSLVKKLVESGADVVCLVRDWIPESELIHGGLLKRVRVVRGDVRDQDLLERILGEFEIVTVFHLAAQTIVGIANRNPVSTFDTNIRGTWALLEACRRSPLVSQIIVASSDKAYGDHEVLPYNESAPLQGRHPYDVSKSCADLISTTYAVSYNLPVVITRCGNFFGPGDLNWNRLVPGTIRSLLRGERPVLRSDGTYIRDYFYVVDGALAYMKLAEELVERPSLSGEAFNFSNERQITVIEFVRLIANVLGTSTEPIIENSASNEIVHQYLSAQKARTMLGWQPVFSLEAAIAETVEWYRSYMSNREDLA